MDRDELIARLRGANKEAIALIDEINERAPSRQFHGIKQALHAKLCSIRATLARAAIEDQSRARMPIPERSALDASIAELEHFEQNGILLDEIENWASFGESVMLCLYELKRLRRGDSAPTSVTERLDHKDVLTILDNLAEFHFLGRDDSVTKVVSYGDAVAAIMDLPVATPSRDEEGSVDREAIEEAVHQAIVKWSNGDQPKPIKAMVADAILSLTTSTPETQAVEGGGR